MITMTNPHLLLAGYILDALDDHDRILFEQHLPGCEDCQRELPELGPLVANLSALAATAPPPHLRDSVLSSITQVPPTGA